MTLKPALSTAFACVTLVASQSCSSGSAPSAPMSSIVSLDAVSPAGPATLTTGQSPVALRLTVVCDAPAGSECHAGFDFIAADGSRVERGGTGGYGQSVGAGTHTVEIGGATQPEFTGQTVGIHAALYLNGTSQELASADYRETELQYTWAAP